MSTQAGAEVRPITAFGDAHLDNRMLSDQVANFLIREIVFGSLHQGKRINEA